MPSRYRHPSLTAYVTQGHGPAGAASTLWCKRPWASTTPKAKRRAIPQPGSRLPDGLWCGGAPCGANDAKTAAGACRCRSDGPGLAVWAGMPRRRSAGPIRPIFLLAHGEDVRLRSDQAIGAGAQLARNARLLHAVLGPPVRMRRIGNRMRRAAEVGRQAAHLANPVR